MINLNTTKQLCSLHYKLHQLNSTLYQHTLNKEIFIVDRDTWEIKEKQLLGEINEVVEKIKLYQLDTGG